MATANEVIKQGLLFKQGGAYRNWKKRYFVLKGSTLSYYNAPNEQQAKGEIDLKTGRGVRPKSKCTLEWPSAAKANLCFGVATDSRTYYIYGTDKADVAEWVSAIQKVIEKEGKPDGDHKSDPEGKPESTASKAVKGSVKLAAKITKIVAKNSGLVDDETADIISAVADAAENQAEAGRDATITDRLKMGGADAAGMVSDNVDNDAVNVVAKVAKEQFEADDDTTVQQRLLMAGGTALQESSGMVDDQIGSAVMNTAGGVLHDQGEADSDTNVKQRVLIAVGSVAGGVADASDNDVVKEVNEVVQEALKDAVEELKDEETEEDEVEIK
ncbi:hypothetical protein EMCRGX_G022121 [Ephydatia muelleri]